MNKQHESDEHKSKKDDRAEVVVPTEQVTSNQAERTSPKLPPKEAAERIAQIKSTREKTLDEIADLEKKSSEKMAEAQEIHLEHAETVNEARKLGFEDKKKTVEPEKPVNKERVAAIEKANELDLKKQEVLEEARTLQAKKESLLGIDEQLGVTNKAPYSARILKSRELLGQPLTANQTYFESPEGYIMIAESGRDAVWCDYANGGKGAWINKMRTPKALILDEVLA